MNLIPQPRKITLGAASSGLILAEADIYTNAGAVLLEYIRCKGGKPIACRPHSNFYFLDSGEKTGTELSLPQEIKEQEEGYYLKLFQGGFQIVSCSEKGLFYGLQTLFQVLQEDVRQEMEITDWPDQKIRGFHLELRYGMPNFQRVLEIMDEIASYKMNTMIIEYEDKFPFEGYPEIVSPLAFTLQQVEQLIEYGKSRFIDIIPLQQTLGHLEYVLKHEKYHGLREVRERRVDSELPFAFNSVGFKQFNFIDEICASNEEAYRMVENLCKEMIEKHPGSKYIHIGCDEAWNLLSCEGCREKYGEKGVKQIFIQHINRMAEVVQELGKVPVLWDDMLRHFEEEDFEQLNKNLLVMCWLYFEGDYQLGTELMKKFKRYGLEVLGASAAKCSEGVNPLYLDLPYFQERLGNIAMWSKLAGEFDIAGIITTAWSNYTGTIAPPHPFFDTIWYPVVFSADRYWNKDSDAAGFEERFMNVFFGVDGYTGSFHNNNAVTYQNFKRVVDSCIRHKYVAGVYEIMSLVSAYRVKSLAIARELYKLFTPTTVYEKEIVIKRYYEVKSMRDIIKPRVQAVLKTYYGEADVEEFMNSRFMMDEQLYAGIAAKLKL